jgi:hypothetical protein
MWLRVKISQKSRERDQTFEHVYGGRRYKIGPKPVKIPNDASAYLLKSFSALIEEVPQEEVPRRKTKK